MKLFLILISIPFLLTGSKSEIITFPSMDGLTITAKTYLTESLENPFIILFHQAGWSLGEYNEIAPKLNQLGYNCVAVDQRSGGEINGVKNQTHLQAKEKNRSTTYLDAFIDMQAALDYVNKKFKPKTLIIWGSSYSAALSLKLSSENINIVDAVLAFSPGEYFSKLGKSKSYISDSVDKLKIPVFITSARDEKPNWESIYNVIPSKDKTYFIPKSEGNHGSRALWDKFADSKDYWEAVKSFLKKYFK